ncbi:MAG: hypothetical protein AAGA64_07400 [Bacteroidota bacterium]
MTQTKRTFVENILKHYQESLLGKNSAGHRLLEKKSLMDISMIEHFRLGYCDGSLIKKLSAKQIKEAQNLGLISEDKQETLKGAIIFPYINEANQTTSLLGWSLNRPDDTQHIHLLKRNTVYNEASLKVYRDGIIVVKSVWEALMLWHPAQGRHKNVIAIEHTQNWQKKLLTSKPYQVTFAFDLEEDKELACELTSHGVKVHRIKWPAYSKGLEDYFTFNQESDFQGTAETLQKLIESAPRIGFKREPNRKIHLVERSRECALFENGTLRYHLRGVTTPSHLKIILSVHHHEKNFTDRIDLYANKSRTAFSEVCSEHLDQRVEKIQGDLQEILTQLESLFEAEALENSQQRHHKIEISQGDKEDSLELLQSPNLLGRIAEDIEKVGYVGEVENKQLGYIVATSRKLPKPCSAIIRSQSGAGKSYLMECITELIPEEDVQFFSRLTPQALYYLEENALCHRLLVVDERNGSEESEYPIRTLQTKKKLCLAVPIKDPNSGKTKTTTLEIKGPIAYMESTTSQKVNPENENRCFEIYLDESDEQTEAIFSAQRKSRTLNGWKRDRTKEALVKLHRNAQRLLRPLKVIIPYIDLIDFPKNWLRARRDHDRFLSLIEGVSFLHQYQRKIGLEGGVEYIEASLEDYAIAYELARRVFSNSLGEMPKPVTDFLAQVEQVVSEIAEQEKKAVERVSFTRRQVREKVKLPDHLIKRYMRQIEDLEYVEVKKSSQGRSYRYRLLPSKRPNRTLDGLTSPQELKKNWNNWKRTGNTQDLVLTR